MASVSRSNDLSSRISSRVTDIALSLGLEQRAVRFETEHRTPYRLVVDELLLIVAGDDLGIARVTLQRALREDRRGAGGGAHHVRGGAGALGGVGHRQAQIGALPLRDRPRRSWPARSPDRAGARRTSAAP